MLTTGTAPALENGQEKPKVEGETFITGCKTAKVKLSAQSEEDEKLLKEYDELQKKDPSFGKRKKYYKYPEDELLDEMDGHERDMNEMLKYLTEVEDLIKGQDLQSIASMMEVTKETMQQHFTAYDKFKDQIIHINNQADEAIKSLQFYDDDKPSTKKKAQTQLERVLEEDGMKFDNKRSQEESKGDIVTTLLSMNSEMRTFSREMESRLDRVYKHGGATKKFGYDSVTNLSEADPSTADKAPE